MYENNHPRDATHAPVSGLDLISAPERAFTPHPIMPGKQEQLSGVLSGVFSLAFRTSTATGGVFVSLDAKHAALTFVPMIG